MGQEFRAIILNNSSGCCEVVKRQLYKTKMCLFLLEGKCSKGNFCSFAHSQEQLRPLPNLKFTKLCELISLGQKCTDINCAYAHNREDLRITNEQLYKVRLCNFNKKNKCLNGIYCRFAHGSSELRNQQSIQDICSLKESIPSYTKQKLYTTSRINPKKSTQSSITNRKDATSLSIEGKFGNIQPQNQTFLSNNNRDGLDKDNNDTSLFQNIKSEFGLSPRFSPKDNKKPSNLTFNNKLEDASSVQQSLSNCSVQIDAFHSNKNDFTYANQLPPDLSNIIYQAGGAYFINNRLDNMEEKGTTQLPISQAFSYSFEIYPQ
ncbi:zinc finger, CCCH type domain-containing protein [Cryptosporidium muris RN66]|uniref:Zinc finger, CCCH type domain-containing protein n=1 Tax=Cryptosporidium muris (strain RN66) TaxID=441375 RepID=B6ABW0_CRYMR|nr:zinc finger, CCCH type domain-containing protein [Cryptosporidium muris RN66]EEA05313.1 zinc finger, CCCH type domain-containing protein [Cryptosporidium muris RN66]|eukprot:XP_002139662.1 zinc finger, CCCH type domain-containing protein [Cryptosporidium muris RN66]